MSWSADTEQTALRLTYTTRTVTLALGGSLFDSARDFNRRVTGGTRSDLFAVAYAADTSSLDASVRWSINDLWNVGANYRAYDNDGSFAVRRDDVLGYVERSLTPRYTVRLSYRNIDYAERGTENYDADILEATLRLGF